MAEWLTLMTITWESRVQSPPGPFAPYHTYIVWLVASRSASFCSSLKQCLLCAFGETLSDLLKPHLGETKKLLCVSTTTADKLCVNYNAIVIKTKEVPKNALMELQYPSSIPWESTLEELSTQNHTKVFVMWSPFCSEAQCDACGPLASMYVL